MYPSTLPRELFDRIACDPESSDWKRMARDNRLVESIKDFRRTYGCGLKEAKDVVEAYRDRMHQAGYGENVKLISLPNGDKLQVRTEGDESVITLVRVMRVHVSDRLLLQTIADCVVEAVGRTRDD